MKTLNKILLCALLPAVAAFASSSCQKSYEKHYGLEIASPKYVIPVGGKTFPLLVWCDASWTATFIPEVDWAFMEEGTDGGRGNGVVRITVLPNFGDAREVTVQLKSGSRGRQVLLSQSGYARVGYITFDPDRITVPAAGGPMSVNFTTNIPPEALESCIPSVPAWVEAVTSLKVLSDNYQEGNNRKLQVSFGFYVQPNESGAARSGSVSIPVPVEWAGDPVKSLSLIQSAE